MEGAFSLCRLHPKNKQTNRISNLVPVNHFFFQSRHSILGALSIFLVVEFVVVFGPSAYLL